MTLVVLLEYWRQSKQIGGTSLTLYFTEINSLVISEANIRYVLCNIKLNQYDLRIQHYHPQKSYSNCVSVFLGLVSSGEYFFVNYGR